VEVDLFAQLLNFFLNVRHVDVEPVIKLTEYLTSCEITGRFAKEAFTL
jgi:hypothetical protein